MTLQPHQERVLVEKFNLDTKINALTAFFPTQTYNNLPPEEKALLREQHEVMRRYAMILGEIIEWWRVT